MNLMVSLKEKDETRHEGEFPFYVYNLCGPENAICVLEHWHSEAEIIIPKTDIIVSVDGKNYECNVNDIVFINPEEIHATFTKHKGTVYHIVFASDIISTPYNQEFISDIVSGSAKITSYINPESTAYKAIFDIIDELITLKSNGDIGVELKIQSLLSGLTHNIVKYRLLSKNVCDEKVIQTRYIKNAIYFMTRHMDEDISIDDIAAELSLSKSYFFRIFRMFTDTTPNDFLNKMRMQKAKEYLLSGKSVIESAIDVGINNIGYFSRLFKKTYGITPGKIKIKKK